MKRARRSSPWLIATLATFALLLAAPAAPAAIVGWGDNLHGEIGAGYKSAPQDPQTASLPCRPTQVSAAISGNLALCPDGSVYSWGGNTLGQLGLGDHVTRLAPTRLPVAGVKQVATGGSHSMILMADGTVRVFGSNLFGEFGNGTTTQGHEVKGDNAPSPQPVPGLSGVCSIASPPAFDIAVMCDGTVKAWGENTGRQIGSPLREVLVPTTVPGLTGIVQASGGGFNVESGDLFGLRADGTLLALGANDQGQLGDGTTVSHSTPVPVKIGGVVGVSASIDHTVAVTQGGQVFTWGSNRYGQNGRPSEPVLCGRAQLACDRNPNPVPSLAGVTDASSGFRYTLAIAEGKPVGFGWNYRRTLGDGTSTQRNAPVPTIEVSGALRVSAGWYHALAVLAGAGPAPNIEVSAGPRALTVRWRDSTQEPKPWTVAWRPVTHPASAWLPAAHPSSAARSFTITGLEPVPYEVRVQNVNYGPRVVRATPLG